MCECRNLPFARPRQSTVPPTPPQIIAVPKRGNESLSHRPPAPTLSGVWGLGLPRRPSAVICFLEWPRPNRSLKRSIRLARSYPANHPFSGGEKKHRLPTTARRVGGGAASATEEGKAGLASAERRIYQRSRHTPSSYLLILMICLNLLPFLHDVDAANRQCLEREVQSCPYHPRKADKGPDRGAIIVHSSSPVLHRSAMRHLATPTRRRLLSRSRRPYRDGERTVRRRGVWITLREDGRENGYSEFIGSGRAK